MKKAAFVGCGTMGALYAKTFSRLGHELYISVDPDVRRSIGRRHYLNCPGIPRDEWNEIDVIILAAPTDQHLQELKKIALRGFRGIVLLEKPYVLPSQVLDFEEFIANEGKGLNIFYSDPYNQLPIFGKLSAVWDFKKLRSIQVEFSKNRKADEAKGRFIDKSFGVLGYEFFHMLSIVKQVLNYDWALDILSCEVSPDEADVLLYEAGRGVEIRISSSMSGRIIQPDMFSGAVFSSCEYQFSAQAHKIEVGHDFRYRKASFHFDEKKSIHIIFERHFQKKNADYKNIHSVVISRYGKIDEIIDFQYNMIEWQVRNALAGSKKSVPRPGDVGKRFKDSLDCHRLIGSFREYSK